MIYKQLSFKDNELYELTNLCTHGFQLYTVNDNG